MELTEAPEIITDRFGIIKGEASDPPERWETFPGTYQPPKDPNMTLSKMRSQLSCKQLFVNFSKFPIQSDSF